MLKSRLLCKSFLTNLALMTSWLILIWASAYIQAHNLILRPRGHWESLMILIIESNVLIWVLDLLSPMLKWVHIRATEKISRVLEGRLGRWKNLASADRIKLILGLLIDGTHRRSLSLIESYEAKQWITLLVVPNLSGIIQGYIVYHEASAPQT